MGPPRLPFTPAIRGQPSLKTEPNRLFPGLFANFATCVDARFGARRIFWIGAARGQVLTCVRPLMRLTRRRPGWEFADQVQISPTRLKRLSQSWFSRSRPNDRCAIPLLRPSHAPTAPQPRALILGAHGRSLVSPTLGHQGPDDAGHLVGQGHAHQHRRLASQHAGDPGAGRSAMAGRPAQDGTRANN